MFIICIICLYPIFLKLGRKVLQKQSSQPVLLNLLESNMIPSSTVTLRANCVGCVLKQIPTTKETESQKTTVAMNR